MYKFSILQNEIFNVRKEYNSPLTFIQVSSEKLYKTIRALIFRMNTKLPPVSLTGWQFLKELYK